MGQDSETIKTLRLQIDALRSNESWCLNKVDELQNLVQMKQKDYEALANMTSGSIKS